jgi:hypothetical protein
MKTVIAVNKDGTVSLNKFKDILNIAKVVYYKVKENKDKTLILSFYDKNKKKIKPYSQSKTK